MARTRPLSREARKAQTREAILDAATRLFVRQGITATSFDQIAQAIGLTRGAVYAHFPSKRRLVDAAIERQAIQVNVDVLYRSDLSLAERLRRFVRGVMELRRRTARGPLVFDAEYFAESLRNPGS